MRRYLFIFIALIISEASVYSLEVNTLKSFFQIELGSSQQIPPIDIRIYEYESTPLNNTRFYPNVLYKSVIEPIAGHDSGSYNIYWKLKNNCRSIVTTQDLYCGFHLGFFGINLPDYGKYTVEVTVQTIGKLNSTTISVPIETEG